VSATIGADTRALVDHGLAELATGLGGLLRWLLGCILWILGSIARSHSRLTVSRCRTVTLGPIRLRGISGWAIHSLRAVPNGLHGRTHDRVGRRGAECDLSCACGVGASLYGKYALDCVLDVSARASWPESGNSDGEGEASGGSLAEIGGSRDVLVS